MGVKYVFNTKMFRRIFLTKLLLYWSIIPFVLNTIALLNGTWDILLSLLIVAFTAPPVLGVYFHQKHQWKLAYIVMDNYRIQYFRVVKDGFLTDTSSYEYEAWNSVASVPYAYKIKKNKIYITGDITEYIFKDRKEKPSEIRKRKTIKIPMYFGTREELLGALNRYNTQK